MLTYKTTLSHGSLYAEADFITPCPASKVIVEAFIGEDNLRRYSACLEDAL